MHNPFLGMDSHFLRMRLQLEDDKSLKKNYMCTDFNNESLASRDFMHEAVPASSLSILANLSDESRNQVEYFSFFWEGGI